MVVKLLECYSQEHPTTVLSSRDNRIELFNIVRQNGEIVGSGEGISPIWAAPYLDYYEGVGIRSRTYMSRQKEHEGNWGDEWNPSIIVGTIDADDSIKNFVLNEKIRIPLFGLIAHDEVFMTSVWRFSNSRFEGYWDKVDLFCILYGVMPFYNLTLEEWEENKDRYVSGHKRINSVRNKIGMAEMLDHKFLNDDRSVQETAWSTGYTVVVNFGNEEYIYADGKIVKSMDYVLIEN